MIINFNSFDPVLETRKTVRLRNINFNGADTGIVCIRILGAGAASAGSEVFIEDCLLDGNFAATARGISEERTGGGELSILNTTVRNNNATGIAIVAGGTGTRLNAVLENVRVLNSNFGVAIANAASVMINRSVFAGNTAAGVEAEGPIAAVEVNVNNSLTSNNGTGVQNGGGTVTLRLSNSDIAFNGTGILGATVSFGNNRLSGNTTPGTAPTAIGSDSNDKGQQ